MATRRRDHAPPVVGTPCPSNGRPRFLAIAGNMGAGKSTFVGFLQSRYGFEPFYEPNDSNPYLTDFYANMSAWAFQSQTWFLTAKFQLHQDLSRQLRSDAQEVLVQDRTIFEDAEVFAENLHRKGVLREREYTLYRTLYETIRETLQPPDLLIYLRCSLKGLKRRIKARGRPEEQAVDPEYLKALQRLYEGWFDRYALSPTLVIETEKLDYLEDLVDRIDLLKVLAQFGHE